LVILSQAKRLTAAAVKMNNFFIFKCTAKI
jgi:hypothetical protein